MNLRELVGKRVCRTSPIREIQWCNRYENNACGYLVSEWGWSSGGYYASVPDYNYCELDNYITVIDVVDDIPIIKERVKKYSSHGTTEQEEIKSISIKYDDDNWKAVDDAIECIATLNNSYKSNKELEKESEVEKPKEEKKKRGLFR